MHQPLVPRRLGMVLVAGAIFLPLCICVVLAVAGIIEVMGDNAGGGVLRRIVLAGGILWIVDLVCLLLVLAIGILCGPDESKEP